MWWTFWSRSAHCCVQCLGPFDCCRSGFFLQIDPGQVVRTLETAVVANRGLWDLGVPGSGEVSDSDDIYPATIARRHENMTSPYKILIMLIMPMITVINGNDDNDTNNIDDSVNVNSNTNNADNNANNNANNDSNTVVMLIMLIILMIMLQMMLKCW